MGSHVPIDAARLRAAVADDRYWNAADPERDAWRAWVGQGFKALYGGDTQASDGVVFVRAYERDGRTVAAHTRSAPTSTRTGTAEPGSAVAASTAGALLPRFHGLALRRLSLLDDASVVPVMARRPENDVLGGRKGVTPEGGGGGVPRPPATGGTPPRPSGQSASPRSQELVDMVAPNGAPVGSRSAGSTADIRTLPGGEPAAEAMFRRLTEGRVAADVTPQGYAGRMYRLDDGTIIGYRPAPSSGSPAIDINIPGFRSVSKLHF
jgi:hypothetical protein